jgi:plastocyanin
MPKLLPVVVLALTSALGGCSLFAEQARLSLDVEARIVAPSEYAFVPATIFAPPHTAVSTTLVNSSDAPHTLVFLEPIDRRTDVIVEPGRRDELDYTTPGPGVYRFVCTVHEQMGGTLIVDEEAAAP